MDSQYKIAVQWHDEVGDNYGDDNDGYLWGIYIYHDDEIVDATWYKSEKERDDNMEN
jgi:hypothetical protein